jgi:8-oxo-dGTP pyrophosphatase MutT (NUDIX family)
MLENFYIGVKGVVRVANKVLILKKKDQTGNYFWDIPGGRIDDNETIEETLHRELKEEVPSLGKYSISKIIGAYRLPKDLNDGLGLVLIFYKIDAESFVASFSDEHEESKWVEIDEIEALRNDSAVYISPGYLEALIEALK